MRKTLTDRKRERLYDLLLALTLSFAILWPIVALLMWVLQ